MRSPQITIKDIARELNISPSTVSRALKDHPDISEKTKRSVQELAQKLKYKPNKIALSLLNSTSKVIGVIVPEIVHHFFSTVISGIQDIAFEAGYSVMICQSNESYRREVDNTKVLLSSMVDGFLVSISKDTRDYEHFKEIQKAYIPLVFFDRICEELDTDRIIINDYEGAFQATEHLISIGCKHIAHFSAPQHLAIGRNRLNGFVQAMRKHKIPINEKLVVKADNPLEGEERVYDLLKEKHKIDGIFTVNDLTAAGALRGIKRAGLHVPRDIALVGFSNGLISRLTDPMLTTIDQHGYEMGKTAAELLIDRLENKTTDKESKIKLLKPTLIVRQSTKRE